MVRDVTEKIDRYLLIMQSDIDSLKSFPISPIPQLKIEPFAGDPKEWPNFVSSFKDMIHDVRGDTY